MSSITDKDMNNAVYCIMLAAISITSKKYLDFISYAHHGKLFLDLDKKEAMDILADEINPAIKGEDYKESMERFQNKMQELMLCRINEKITG